MIISAKDFDITTKYVFSSSPLTDVIYFKRRVELLSSFGRITHYKIHQLVYSTKVHTNFLPLSYHA